MKIFNHLASIKLSIILFVIFALMSAAATFLEAKYDTATAWALIYGALPFAIVQLLLGLNLFAALFRYQMYEKLPLLIFHLSFLFMLLGAALTRYYGFEGSMHLREGQASSQVLSRNMYLSLSDGQNTASKALEISQIGFNFASIKLDDLELSLHKVIPRAKAIYLPDESGKSAFVFNASSDEASAQVNLENYLIFGKTIVYKKGTQPPRIDGYKYLQIGKDDLSADFSLRIINTKDSTQQIIAANESASLALGDMIAWDNYKLTPVALLEHSKTIYESNDDEKNELVMLEFIAQNALAADKSPRDFRVYVPLGGAEHFEFGGKKYLLSYARQKLNLDFKIRLDRFVLERYMGSNSPKSYESFITILQPGASEQSAHIYMNNVLDYAGMRFFQSSYDTDLRGSILSINQDPGKMPTYLGYFLLGLGLFLNICSPRSRFRQLARQLAKLGVISVFCLASLNQSAYANELDDALAAAAKNLAPISLNQHAHNLSLLGVKRHNSRIAPFATQAADVLAKISHKSSFENLDATTVMIKLMSDFEHFKDKKIILVHNEQIAKMLGISGKFASFSDFFKNEQYLLKDEVNIAARTAASARTTLQKDLLKIDERLNTLYFASLGGFLNAINENNIFLNPLEAKNPSGRAYLLALLDAAKNDNYALADDILARIKAEQMIDSKKFELEIYFSHLGIFSKLILAFLLCGLGLLAVVFVQIFSLKKCRLAKNIFYVLNILLFIILAISLGIRGYLAAHAPWSNSYESLLYIATTLSFAGIVFARRSAISLALSSLLAGVVLFVAHLGSIDPQIGNLAPVLSSIWLSIHVSIITASYGFLGLCALLGLFCLLLFALLNAQNHSRIKASIKEACKINEMAMILGLSLLVMGNFLGGVWANESWGRYWGWDSKETWALISILVYAAVLHARLIRALNNQFVFSLLSLFAYYSILMTYFGVNYFLTGMHSYAVGDGGSIPVYAYLITGGLALLAILAARNSHYAERL